MAMINKRRKKKNRMKEIKAQGKDRLEENQVQKQRKIE
jgi:hypothetical protein